MRINLKIQTVNEGKWDGRDTDFEAYNSGGVEVEVGEFLYGMVRVLKPKRILETGTHHGISSTYMGMGLKDNGFGKLTTIDNVADNFNRATRLHHQHFIQDYVDIMLQDVRTVELDGEFDLLLLDSEPQYRFDELTRFYPHLKGGGYAFIHDLHRHLSQEGNNQPFGEIPPKMRFWIEHGDLIPFHLPTPRGLAGFYKKHPGDYCASSTIRWWRIGVDEGSSAN